uniref:Kinesin motor domain-containing protein n=1 Tax=Chromera velia CCMP2878 TaxID=1169474 RepID=A0A0G4F8H0_9ALVE|eukprot:Cvel_15770.t1-p1 / transcript=Cvel_15770.t1 / gene=Cvel_15770 / organism=Chromera_velia_CCMP2878 / gene_product=Kinesin-related protein 1, putative / transcript_product=Kinesin-related protein 1, putative / location=Cvel_scaffold1182:26421-41598(+) / protein_length=1180 / sequence_SO=supercontig / SO=protein_coding / is_pseudo=false
MSQTIIKYCNAKNSKDQKDQSRDFAFDRVFWSVPGTAGGFAGQRDVFHLLGKRALVNAWKGFNGCIFAYGQTGSGKSHSMIGTGDDAGLMPRVCRKLFMLIEASKRRSRANTLTGSQSANGRRVSVGEISTPQANSRMGMAVQRLNTEKLDEILAEDEGMQSHNFRSSAAGGNLNPPRQQVGGLNLFDMTAAGGTSPGMNGMNDLNASENDESGNAEGTSGGGPGVGLLKEVAIRQHPSLGVILGGANTPEVDSVEDLNTYLNYGMKNRTVAATRNNARSSRSHAIFTIYLCRMGRAPSEGTQARLHMVDLAGSEFSQNLGGGAGAAQRQVRKVHVRTQRNQDPQEILLQMASVVGKMNNPSAVAGVLKDLYAAQRMGTRMSMESEADARQERRRTLQAVRKSMNEQNELGEGAQLPIVVPFLENISPDPLLCGQIKIYIHSSVMTLGSDPDCAIVRSGIGTGISGLHCTFVRPPLGPPRDPSYVPGVEGEEMDLASARTASGRVLSVPRSTLRRVSLQLNAEMMAQFRDSRFFDNAPADKSGGGYGSSHDLPDDDDGLSSISGLSIEEQATKMENQNNDQAERETPPQPDRLPTSLSVEAGQVDSQPDAPSRLPTSMSVDAGQVEAQPNAPSRLPTSLSVEGAELETKPNGPSRLPTSLSVEGELDPQPQAPARLPTSLSVDVDGSSNERQDREALLVPTDSSGAKDTTGRSHDRRQVSFASVPGLGDVTLLGSDPAPLDEVGTPVDEGVDGSSPTRRSILKQQGGEMQRGSAGGQEKDKERGSVVFSSADANGGRRSRSFSQLNEETGMVAMSLTDGLEQKIFLKVPFATPEKGDVPRVIVNGRVLTGGEEVELLHNDWIVLGHSQVNASLHQRRIRALLMKKSTKKSAGSAALSIGSGGGFFSSEMMRKLRKAPRSTDGVSFFLGLADSSVYERGVAAAKAGASPVSKDGDDKEKKTATQEDSEGPVPPRVIVCQRKTTPSEDKNLQVSQIVCTYTPELFESLLDECRRAHAFVQEQAEIWRAQERERERSGLSSISLGALSESVTRGAVENAVAAVAPDGKEEEGDVEDSESDDDGEGDDEAAIAGGHVEEGNSGEVPVSAEGIQKSVGEGAQAQNLGGVEVEGDALEVMFEFGTPGMDPWIPPLISSVNGQIRQERLVSRLIFWLSVSARNELMP